MSDDTQDKATPIADSVTTTETTAVTETPAETETETRESPAQTTGPQRKIKRSRTKDGTRKTTKTTTAQPSPTARKKSPPATSMAVVMARATRQINRGVKEGLSEPHTLQVSKDYPGWIEVGMPLEELLRWGLRMEQPRVREPATEHIGNSPNVTITAHSAGVDWILRTPRVPRLALPAGEASSTQQLPVVIDSDLIEPDTPTAEIDAVTD